VDMFSCLRAAGRADSGVFWTLWLWSKMSLVGVTGAFDAGPTLCVAPCFSSSSDSQSERLLRRLAGGPGLLAGSSLGAMLSPEASAWQRVRSDLNATHVL
jgi:hypothetical protein